jgi:hypothetical protein
MFEIKIAKFNINLEIKNVIYMLKLEIKIASMSKLASVSSYIALG